MKKILRKYWDRKKSLGLHTSDDYPKLTNYDISEENIKCEECTRYLWTDTKKISYLKYIHFSLVTEKN